MRVVVRARLLFGDADLAEHFILLDARLIICRSKFRRRSSIVMFSCLSAALNCSSVSILFSFLMLSTAVLNCSSLSLYRAPAALHDEHLVHASTMSCGVMSFSALRSCALFGSLFEIDLLPLLTEHRDLPRFQLGFREDLAVHLHENLLDDLGARTTAAATSVQRDGGRRQARRDRIVARAVLIAGSPAM